MLISSLKSHYLVNPEDHGVLQVKWKLFRRAKGRKALHTGHHLLNADHLHCVDHHQGIDHRYVRALPHRKRKKKGKKAKTFRQIKATH